MNRILYFLCIVGGILISCGENRELEYEDRTEVNDWIHAQMKENYLYASSMKNLSENSWYAIPEVFFEMLRTSNEMRGGSYISELYEGAIPLALSYGYLYDYYSFDTLQCVRVVYVAPQSPAADAGMVRGDWVLGYNGLKITDKNYQNLSLTSLGGYTLTMGRTVSYQDGKPVIQKEKDIRVQAPRLLTGSPVEKDTVFEWVGRKVGYLLYSRFEADASGGDDFSGTYNEDLRRACASFASQGVQELVLDLRFTTGTALGCAQLLGTMLAPAMIYNSPFCYQVYNANHPTIKRLFSPSIIGAGRNLNLSSLYVITSSRTRGAAEMLINNLSPYMRVIVVGMKTGGYDLLTDSYTHTEYGLRTLKLATNIVMNADTLSFSNGINPAVKVSEKDSIAYPCFPLGNLQEILLHRTLEVMRDSL